MASANADEMAYQAFKRRMEYLLQYPVVVTNPYVLPEIKDGEFLPIDGFKIEIKGRLSRVITDWDTALTDAIVATIIKPYTKILKFLSEKYDIVYKNFNL